MSKQSIHGLANGASGQTEQKADEAASLQGTVQQDRHLDSTGLPQPCPAFIALLSKTAADVSGIVNAFEPAKLHQPCCT